MNTYNVGYAGNASRFKNLSLTVNANSEREVVVDVYQSVLDENFFPQKDGTILDCNGDIIAGPDDNAISYDGGYFSADLVED